jgi:primosomal protein N' (replication factor Y)
VPEDQKSSQGARSSPRKPGVSRPDPDPGDAELRSTAVSAPILKVAVAAPLRRLFDYLPPIQDAHPALQPGVRVRIPFGRSRSIGILVRLAAQSEVPRKRLRPVLEVLDRVPVLCADDLELLEWASTYYQHPIGDALFSALPLSVRRGGPARASGEAVWRLTETGAAELPPSLARAPRQAAALRLLRDHPQGVSHALWMTQPESLRSALRALRAKGWVEREERPCLGPEPLGSSQPGPAPNRQQQAAVEAAAAAERFAVFLLHGVTGSGKTEVYLRLVERALARGKQAMVLVPEIGLTPQLIARFRRRIAEPVAVLHSGLGDRQRLCAWHACRSGSARVLIGTRSAVFTPLREPGLFVVDEEHDPSFKQQEGFRYSARDFAIKRARQLGVPIVLGSATPSLESLHNAACGRFQHLVLERRAGASRPPAMALIDVRARRLEEGLSEPLLAAIAEQLERSEQAMLFLNRRGYAPILICHHCGWVADCRRCDARMTFHRARGALVCHHCGADRPVDPRCPVCAVQDLRALGHGTERVERALREHFPNAGIVRIDRDSTRPKGSLEDFLAKIRSGETDILIGTQMLAKGHHFPRVTLVGILGVDQGLFSPDFRAGERLAQLIIQVAGRAGRAERPGRVLIQTHHPEHRLLQTLLRNGYADFAAAVLEERRLAELPPFSAQTLMRAESSRPDAPRAFLSEAVAKARGLASTEVSVWGPVPAPMERRQGRYRYQVLLQALSRHPLQRFLRGWVPLLETLPTARGVRWSVDVDPIELF